ncbi:type II toxin-antitoxin system Phd/YefM family antitoxin [Candidatus Collierbacteria bacterium]|nr:type II toxin-antitoxin system Phd/YefM family antitoxin [Candidatus Collierbacteria bacterium]
MTYVSISELKTNPAEAISASLDYPVAIQKRSKTQAYLVGKDIFEKLVAQMEDIIDAKAVREANFSDVVPFEKVVAELGLDL